MKSWSIAEDVTILILTFNEESNIHRTLQALAGWAGRILVIDSYSTDKTCEVCAVFPNVQVIQRPFIDHADQWNFGLKQVKSEWVLTMDADYVMPPTTRDVLKQALSKTDVWGYSARFDYLVNGKRVLGSVLPPRTVLFRLAGADYINDGHTQRLQKAGKCMPIELTIAHDDRKPISRWLKSQIRYAELEAKKLTERSWRSLGVNDKVRHFIVLAPVIVFFHVYLVRGGLFSGWPGLMYALQRLTAEIMLSLFLLDRVLKRNSS